jgi:hypothetical protein
MSEEPVPASSPPSVAPGLREVAELLRQADHLEPEAQQTLAELVEELGEALATAPLPAEQSAQLAQTAIHLADAVHRQHTQGVLSAARERLDQAAVGVEARAPFVAGVARRLLEALSNLGI